LDYENGLMLKSCCDRIQRTLAGFIDIVSELLDPKAKFLGNELGIDLETQNLFVEEIIRGSLFFAVSMLVKKVDKALRPFVGTKNCLIISPKIVKGTLRKIESLTMVAFQKFDEDVIFICEKVTGEEDIPEGVVGVISKSELDTLAHVSVRARNSGVFLAVVLDIEILSRFESLENSSVVTVLSNGSFDLKQNFESAERRRSFKVQPVKEPIGYSTMFLPFDDFSEGKTGAKGNNCLELKKRLPSHIRVPQSSAVPYGSYEHVLSQSCNTLTKQLIQEVLDSGLDLNEETSQKLRLVQSLILKLELEDAEKSVLHQLLQSLECPLDEENWGKAWIALKKVWASKYNLRVFLNSVKARISLDSIRMAVLCQQVVNGDYAFVLHTKNPMNDNLNEIYGEIVLGLGETLVSAADGRALAFVVDKNNGKVEIESFCNKSEVLKGAGIIFRSDSNSEDLPGFAGAGLFDSFTMDQATSVVPRYSKEQIVVNSGFREFVIQQLKDVGIAVEEIYSGVPQDIEGCIKDGVVYVVQSRPQV
jgi:alpha-glucan,water dikinase